MPAPKHKTATKSATKSVSKSAAKPTATQSTRSSATKSTVMVPNRRVKRITYAKMGAVLNNMSKKK